MNFEIVKTNIVIVPLEQQSLLFNDNKTYEVILKQYEKSFL